MQSDNTWMAGAKSHESVLLSQSCLELVIAFQMTFIEYFDSIFLLRRWIYSMHYLVKKNMRNIDWYVKLSFTVE